MLPKISLALAATILFGTLAPGFAKERLQRHQGQPGIEHQAPSGDAGQGEPRVFCCS
jgi:hypothetical protein